MGIQKSTDERAKMLAVQLQEKLQKCIAEPPQEDRMAEANVIQAEIEKLGFIVIRELGLKISKETGEITASAEVTLYRSEKPVISH